MSAKSIITIIHNSCETHNENFRHKIGLANWEIRPWILPMRRRMTWENVFLQFTSYLQRNS